MSKNVTANVKKLAFCAMALALPGEETRVVRGECVGELLHERAGQGGFGYDPLLLVGEKTVAEMTAEEKDAISHRGNALRVFREILKGELDV